MMQLFSPDEDFKAYKTTFSSSHPNIPYLGVHLGDIRFIDRFTRTQTKTGVNLAKLSTLTDELSTFTLIPVSFH